MATTCKSEQRHHTHTTRQRKRRGTFLATRLPPAFTSVASTGAVEGGMLPSLHWPPTPSSPHLFASPHVNTSPCAERRTPNSPELSWTSWAGVDATAFQDNTFTGDWGSETAVSGPRPVFARGRFSRSTRSTSPSSRVAAIRRPAALTDRTRFGIGHEINCPSVAAPQTHKLPVSIWGIVTRNSSATRNDSSSFGNECGPVHIARCLELISGITSIGVKVKD